MQPVRFRQWFNSPLLLVLLVVASTIPLLPYALPPLTDLPGHIGRYHIELNAGNSAILSQWYSFHWSLFGNLGVDLLVIPLTQFFPLETAVKIIVVAIPPLTVAGMLYLAREVHGHIPATVFFALPLAYAYPFQFGFVNFTLSVAFAFISAALWLHLGRLRRARLRALLFMALSFCLFLTHCVGWAMFGMIVFAIELANRRDEQKGWPQAVGGTIVALLPLATPAILILNWANYGPAGETFFLPLQTKLAQFFEILRDRIKPFDIFSALLLYALLICGLKRFAVRFEKRLGIAAMLLGGAYCLTPGMLKDAAFADFRMLPYLVAVALLALEPVAISARRIHLIAAIGLIFFGTRLVSQTMTYRTIDRVQQQQLAALEHIARGSRVLVLVNTPCESNWYSHRMMHLGSMATARRDAYTNGMWPMPGGRLMTITYAASWPFQYSSSQLLQPAHCRVRGSMGLREALEILPRDAFDYVWLIDLPRSRWPRATWLRSVWHGERGILFRIVSPPLTTIGPRSEAGSMSWN